IEDEVFRLQACAELDVEDEARRRTLDASATPPEIRKYLADTGILQRLRSDPRPQRVPPAPALGLTLERMIAPILVGPDLYGYIWIIAGRRALDQLDVQAVERAAHIAALILTRERSVFSAEQRVKAGLIENLLDPAGAQNPYALQDILRQFGLHGDCAVILADIRDAGMSDAQALIHLAGQVQTDAGVSGTALEWNGRLLWMLSPAGSSGQMTQKLADRWIARGGSLAAGISAPAGNPGGIRAAYQQASQALQIGLALGGGKSGVWSYEGLGYLPWLHSLPPGLKGANPYMKLVRDIARHDAENATAYLVTLEACLQNQFNHSRTAQALFIHRNSLLKRLDRIRDLWGIDFE
ncbi:MAG: helix-turn-helix domain-containing protein, partial [Anaerolineaceae bacterium]